VDIEAQLAGATDKWAACMRQQPGEYAAAHECQEQTVGQV